MKAVRDPIAAHGQSTDGVAPWAAGRLTCVLRRQWDLSIRSSSSARHDLMQDRLRPETDLSTEELFGRVLEDLRSDDDEDLSALVALHERPTQRVIARSVELCKSRNSYERTVGLRVLRELGHPYVDREKLWAPLEQMVIDLVMSDESPEVVRWAISCLGYQAASTDAFDAVIRRADDPDWHVRFAVAAALPSLMTEDASNPRGIGALLALTDDAHPDIRSYAIMGLVGDLNLANEIEPTLRTHLTDPDEQIADYCRQALSTI